MGATTLSGKDYAKVLETIDVVYSVPDTGAMFHAFCRQLHTFVGIYSAIFIPANPKTGEFLFGGYQIYNNGEGALLAYLAHYAPRDPFATCGWFMDHPNEVARNTDLLPRLAETEFARDFLLPLASVFYVLACTLSAQGDTVGIIGIHRQKGDGNFSDREKAIVNILLPHVARTIHNRELARDETLFGETHGVIMADEGGRVLFLNNAAREALGNRAVATIPDPGLGSGTAFFRNGPRAYRVRTVPISKKKGGKFIVLEPQPSGQMFTAKLDGFRLSGREKEVAAQVIQGYSNREVASRLFISEMTVKDHLKSIFGKLDIRRRSELASRVFGFRAPENRG
ncbi:MAG: helix-turn-helix transcriptional regulator [Acidobacteriaceae bacterium]